MGELIRINKYLAHAGIVTRRSADVLIDAGKVYVNGKRAVRGQKVTEQDRIEIRDHEPNTHRYLLYYKPKGVVTHSPEEGETDILGRLKADHGIEGVFPIGRLEKDAEGLILLTDDGRITKGLLDPERNVEKEYEVRVDKKATPGFLKRLCEGVSIEGYTTKLARTARDPRNEHAFLITLTEGKKHQLRRMCAALGYQVVSLCRVRFGTFHLRPLKVGAYRALSQREVSSLLASLELR